MDFSTDINIRGYHIDVFGHMNNARYLELMEEARWRYIDATHFQETLTNVARHAQASQVYVNLDEHEGHLTLQVNDNGKGIEPCKISDSKSLGLLGMRERVSPWGGEVDIQGEMEQGTTVTIRIHARTL